MGFSAVPDDSEDLVLTLLEYMIWPILLLVIVGVAALVPNTFRNIISVQLILWQAVPIGLLVLGESICLLLGHFDLSVGAIMGFSAMFTGMLLGNCPSCWASSGVRRSASSSSSSSGD